MTLPSFAKLATAFGGSRQLKVGDITLSSLAPVAKAALRYASIHTGLPALVVAAIAIVVGYKILKRTARFAAEVTVITLALAAATEAGWLRW